MAATGKTPILLYGSTTATNQPSAGNLTNSSDGCEIAINVADKNLFFKDATNTVNTVPIRQSGTSSSGWLSSTDWNTFNNKQPAGTYVTSVTGTAPVVSSGGTTPAISMAAANGSTNGYLTSTDWTTFNNKQPAGSYALTTGNLSQFASTTSAQLAGVISDETGSGSLVFGTAPTITGFTSAGNISAKNGSGFTTGNALIQQWTAYAGSANQYDICAIQYYTGAFSNAGQIAFSVANYAGLVEAMRINQSGGVSIGNTTDPGATNLSVTGTITSGSTITGKSGSTIYSSAYTDNNFYLQQGTGQTTGNANILNFKDQSGTTAQIIGYGSAYGGGLNYAVRIVSGGSGGVQLTSGATSWASVSDERVKDIIEPIDNAVQRLSDWRSVIGKYETDPEGTRRTFLIAQDVLKTLPEVVDTGNPDEYSLRYQEIIPLLVAAINEQQATIESLNDRLTALENK